ncbi:MAG TPA: hypothetical protein VK636_23435 [Gemmatimonadaceae bacterium]|nr:hypothetical protein [Gemmatimonadaceae bacterium]
MPKVIVLFHGADSAAEPLAESAASGAESVRFTEVEIRAIGSAESSSDKRRPRFTSAEDLRSYDGVIMVCCAPGAALDEFVRLTDDLGQTLNASSNVVFTVLGGGETPLLARVAGLGGILVSAQTAIDLPQARASIAGARNAKVVSWVRHALSHEQHDHEHHSHEHHDHSHHSHEPRPMA